MVEKKIVEKKMEAATLFGVAPFVWKRGTA